MTPAESDRLFDELMRRKLATDEVQPSAGLWPAVSATLPPPPPRLPWRPVGAAGFLGVLIGVMMGWWTGPGAPEKGRFQRSKATGVEMKTVGSEMKTVGSEMKTAGSEMKTTRIGKKTAGVEKKTAGIGKKTAEIEKKTAGVEKKTVGSGQTIAGVEMKTVGSGKTIAGSKTTIAGGGRHPVSAGAAASATGGAVVVGVAGSSSAAPLPITLWQTALAQDSAIRREAARSVAPVQPDSSSRVLALIVTQRATLRVLQRQLDTLKAALPAEPAALPVVVAAIEAAIDSAALADSVARPSPALLPARRWAVALLTDATTPWGALPTPPDRRETLGGATGRSLQLEFQPENARWRLRAGLGDVRQAGQFRGVDEQTRQTFVSDTVTITHVDVFSRTDTTLIIQLDSFPQLNPRVNANLQIIGYDTSWALITRTSYQLIVTNDTVRRTTQSIQTRLETARDRREQQLRPTYRFWAVPVALQFDVVRHGRWRAGLSAGGQVLIFRGGDAPVRTADGSYALRPVGPRGGPFRPVSLALTAALDVRYRLTDRLSLLAGAGGRGWLLNPVRGDGRPRMQPTGQVGVSWGL